MKKQLAAAILASLTLAIAAPAFAAANPFIDVPAKHWAYDAVSSLAAAGIVDGYGDGTFRGDKTMTRYEMAQIVAKALTKYDAAKPAEKAALDKLSKEFGAELKNLGVRVAALEKNAPNIKLSAESRFQSTYIDNVATKDATTNYARQRLMLSGKVNDKVTGNVRIEYTIGDTASTTDQFFDVDRLYFDVKDVANLNWTIGRQNFLLGRGVLTSANPEFLDGVMAKTTGKDWNIAAYYGQQKSKKAGTGTLDPDGAGPLAAVTYNTGDIAYEKRDVAAISAWAKLGSKVDLTASFLSDKDNNEDIWAVGTKVELGKIGKKKLSMLAEYAQNNDAVDDPEAYFVQLTNGNASQVFTGNIGAFVNKADKGDQAYLILFKSKDPNFQTFKGTGGTGLANGNEAWEFAYQNAIMKDVVMTLDYTDTQTKAGVQGAKTTCARFEMFF